VIGVLDDLVHLGAKLDPVPDGLGNALGQG
jgi:hypothetical protein